MGPGVGVHVALRLLLDAVVTHRCRRIKGLCDVVRGQLCDEAGLDRVVRPHAGEAIGLELRLDRAAAGPARPAARRQEAEEVLDVMAVLVGDHVGLGERPAFGAELALELLEEAEVEVDELVLGAVERPDLRVRRSAGGVGRVGVQDRLRIGVVLDRLAPVALDAVDVADDPAVVALVRDLAGGAGGVDVTARVGAAAGTTARWRDGDLPVRQQVNREHDERAKPATDGDSAAATSATAILDLAGVELCIRVE